jgi:hypothetical protein
MHGLSRLDHSPSCSKRQQIRISSLTDMSDGGHEAAPPRWTRLGIVSENRIMRGAWTPKNLRKKGFTDSNSSRLQALVAKFEKAIQAHSARLAASTAALAALLPVAYSENIQEKDIRLWLIQRTYKKRISVTKHRLQQKMQHLSFLL